MIAPTPTPPAPPTVLQPPTISLQAGTYAYATPITIIASQLSTTAEPIVSEYSWDDGVTWIEGLNTTITNSGVLCVRTRQGRKMSDVAIYRFTVFYKQVLFVGNSITSHAPAHEVGWHGNWGMAASAADKDYVSVLMANLTAQNATTQQRIFSGVSFEQNFANYDFSTIQNNADLQSYLANTDLIVMRIGENVNDANVLSQNFEIKYKQLIEALRKNPKARVVCTNSFWPGQNINNAIRNVATANGFNFVDLNALWLDQSNTATGQFANPDVAKHPSDKGMKAIAEAIWGVIR